MSALDNQECMFVMFTVLGKAAQRHTALHQQP